MDERRKLYNWLVENKQIFSFQGIEKATGLHARSIYKAVNGFQELTEQKFKILQKAMTKYGFKP